MKAQRFPLAILLALGLLWLAGPAWSYLIEDEIALNRASQIVNLKGVSTTGEINFNDLKRVMPDGTETAFGIPAGHSLLMFRFSYDFKPDTPPPGINVRILPFAFWINGAGFVNGISSAISIWPSGLPIGGPTDNYKIQAVNNNVVVPGAFTVYLTGMLIYSNATPPPLEILLLD
jgi:hypothetical protein